MDMFWWMIGGVVTLALVALATALYMWKLYKDFPETMKAKIVSVEKVPIAEFKEGYRYHFKGRNKGNRMMTDYITYKEKKLRVGDKMTVRMSKDGHTCHSNFPMWPAVTSIICILMALVLIFVYMSETQSPVENSEPNTFLQESGYYIVTDTDVLFHGDTMGLVMIEGGGIKAVSTGDYGFIFYQGEPHYENEGASLKCVHSISTNVLTDGTVDTLDHAIVDQVNDLGYTINTISTLYVSEGIEEDAESHEHNHDIITDETQFVNDSEEDSYPEVSTESPNNTVAEDDVIEYTTSPTESIN